MRAFAPRTWTSAAHHLHVDHVGWNTRWIDGRWQPTFPNARYVYSRAEEDFYATPAAQPRRIIFDDS